MIVIRSFSHSPEWNFFLESELAQWSDVLCASGTSNACPGERLLLLYINSPAVIIGRNQSVEAEADVAWCRAKGIPIVRRLSGGGAVWHDEGNINFAFISGGDNAVLDSAARLLEPVIEALAAFGVRAVIGSRRELLVAGLKISGTASYKSRGYSVFHGTLLYSTHLGSMQRALWGNPAARGRKITSVPSIVLNLRTLLGTDVSAETFLDGFIATLVKQSCDKTSLRR